MKHSIIYKNSSYETEIKLDEKQFRLINKKPILPKKTEILDNKRARSAKLRIAEKI